MSTAAADHRHRRARKSRAWIWWTIVAILVVVIAALVWVGVRGIMAANELRQALPAASRVQQAVLSGDAKSAASGAAVLRTHADRAHSLTSDPVWRVVQLVPGIGPNLKALGGVSDSAASVADKGLGKLTTLSGTLNASAFKPQDGALPLKPLADAAPALTQANAAVQAGYRTAEGISTKGVIGPLASAVTQYRDELGQVAGFTDASSRAATLLPQMLGADGPRSYLVLVLNNAELRASGGIPGSVAHITASNGRITLDSQYADSAFGPYDQPVVPLDGATSQLYGDITGEYMMDVTLTPRFDESAKLAMAMWKQRFGQSVDGVISLDPVALKYILAATGPVEVGAGTPFASQLTSDNVVKSLLSDVYANFTSPEEQDLYFEAASGAVFAKLAAGDFDPTAMLRAFTQIGQEHRLNVWSNHADERKSLGETTLSGGPARSAPGEQRFGVYLADGTGSKMDYYLHTAVKLGQVTCSPEGPLYVLEVTLTNQLAPGTQLPAYVSGDGVYGVAPGTIRTQVTTYGSPDVEFGNAFSGSGGAYPVKFVKDVGRSVAQYVVDLKPGESSTVRLVYNPKKGKSGKIAADVTPQINPVTISSGRFDCGTVLK